MHSMVSAVAAQSLCGVGMTYLFERPGWRHIVGAGTATGSHMGIPSLGQCLSMALECWVRMYFLTLQTNVCFLS